ncbi:MAG TPA: ABC transporter ATP-binding protein [Chloroflexota bacterium]|nr:ABC transporter ATP-binding protein [Chloroflexota bacterium]
MNANTLVELIDVTKIYDAASSQRALDGVSLRIAAGKITAVMGPSGSGKSTLLNLVAGIDRATGGRIVVDGLEITRLGETALARYRRAKVGLVFQFFNLLNNLTVLDNVLIPAQLAGVAAPEAGRRAGELLEQLGIADQARKYPARLSGGQRQRVAVARALVNRPVLLLADEPTGALDTHSGEQVLDLFRDLNSAGQTIVLVTHDPRLAERYADRIVTLVDGAVATNAPVLEAVR